MWVWVYAPHATSGLGIACWIAPLRPPIELMMPRTQVSLWEAVGVSEEAEERALFVRAMDAPSRLHAKSLDKVRRSPLSCIP